MKNRAAFWIGILLSLLWVGFVALAYSQMGDSPAIGIFELVAAFMPLMLIWMAVVLAGTLSELRSEAKSLRAAVTTLRGADARATPVATGLDPTVSAQLGEIADLTRQNDQRLTAIAAKTFADTGQPMPPRQVAALGDGPEKSIEQPDLPLADPGDSNRLPVSVQEFIKALNFPDNTEDKEGFRVLRRALEDRRLGPLVNSAKDILSLMSEDEIFMDDLTPDKPSPRVWRSFAAGKRGIDVTGLGGIRDRTALSLTRARLKNDPVFREAAHEFLRDFDDIFQVFEKTADDSELQLMGETRTARAFMLLGRVTGAFD